MAEDVNEMTQNQDNPSIPRSRSRLYLDIDDDQTPIVYRPEYNISLFGMEKLHPFDAGKWGNVIKCLDKKKVLNNVKIVSPEEAHNEDLSLVHTPGYIRSLKWSVNVARITEVPPAILLPNCILQERVLRPFRYQTGGSALAGKLAMERGWAINIGGGFHHCSSMKGGGFCAYADITLAIRLILLNYPNVHRIMIIDLDAHQGNGHERDFIGRRDVYILDVFNKYIYPRDEFAKQAISRKIELFAYTEDEEYLQKVNIHVEGALNEFHPQFVVYNAGTDIMIGDPLGLMSISKKGIIERDEIVWRKVRHRGIPLMMVTSGGYQRSTAAVIADSIVNLKNKDLISINAG